jgi:hypothetical protein
MLILLTLQITDGETFKSSQLRNIEVVRKVIKAKYEEIKGVLMTLQVIYFIFI